MRFDDEVFDFSGFGQQGQEPAIVSEVDERASDAADAKRAHRRTKECTILSQRYEYRRAFSEVRLLEAMKYVVLQDGHTYNFITAGDVDSLSFLKVVLNQHDLDFMLCSTWCMAAEDILQMQQWWEAGRLFLKITVRYMQGVTSLMIFILEYRQAQILIQIHGPNRAVSPLTRVYSSFTRSISTALIRLSND